MGASNKDTTLAPVGRRATLKVRRDESADGRPMGMASPHIREALENASRYLTEHPEEATSTDSQAIATVVDGLVVRVTGPDGSEITTDMVPSVGGTASAPSPGWLLRAAEASCVATLIAMRAAMLEQGESAEVRVAT